MRSKFIGSYELWRQQAKALDSNFIREAAYIMFLGLPTNKRNHQGKVQKPCDRDRQ